MSFDPIIILYSLPLILTIVFVIVAVSQKKSFLQKEAVLQEQLNRYTHQIEEKEQANEALIKEKNELERDYAVLHTRFESSTMAHTEKLKVLDEAKVAMQAQFENLAAKIFEKQSQNFNVVQQQNLELLLKPFREQITQFSKQTSEQFVAESKERHLLKDEIFRLKSLNERISEDALNLTNALKGENKTQGNWGEIVLERILEESGLREGYEYQTQAHLKNEMGKSYRPDVVIHLPQDKDIVIDSKVSLVAYDAFVRETDPQLKDKALKEHIRSINNHIKGLSEKRYENLEGLRSLDFVLLFMPIEGAFLLALEHDNSFFSQAYDANIIVVSPSTLLVTLRTIEHIWRNERQEMHAQEIAQKAEDMYDKFVLFVDEMQKMGQQIDKTKESYDTAMKRLSSGTGNLIKRASDMKALGLKPKKQLSISAEEDA